MKEILYNFPALKVEYVSGEDTNVLDFFRRKFNKGKKRQMSTHIRENTRGRKTERESYRDALLADIMNEKRQSQKKEVLDALETAERILKTDLERLKKKLKEDDNAILTIQEARKVKIAVGELRTAARLPSTYSERFIPNDSDGSGHIKPVKILLAAEDAEDDDFAADLFDNDVDNDGDVSETIENTEDTDE